jgi:hypothetical protein
MWAEHPAIWTTRFESIGNIYLSTLVQGFNMMDQQLSFENVRNAVRMKLHAKNPLQFPMGANGISVATLCMEMLKPQDCIASSQLICSHCDYEGPEKDDKLTYLLHADPSVSGSTSDWVQTIVHNVRNKCPQCNGSMMRTIYYTKTPDLLVLEYPNINMITSHQITVNVYEKSVNLYLRGIVYAGGYHFTSRFISEDGTIWYHDGMTTGAMCKRNGHISMMLDDEFKRYENKILVLAVYARK